MTMHGVSSAHWETEGGEGGVAAERASWRAAINLIKLELSHIPEIRRARGGNETHSPEVACQNPGINDNYDTQIIINGVIVSNMSFTYDLQGLRMRRPSDRFSF